MAGKGPDQNKAIASARLNQNYDQIGLSFEPNAGQADRRVKFRARGEGLSISFTQDEARILLGRAPAPAHAARTLPIASAMTAANSKQASTSATVQAPENLALTMKLEGANQAAEVEGVDKLPGVTNYFVGRDPHNWHAGIPTYSRVRYRGVYPGVDLVYYGNHRELECDWVVSPGARTDRIKLAFEGADHLDINRDGDLVLGTPRGQLLLRKPVAYQEFGGRRHPVASRYTRLGGSRVGLRLASYDRDKPLIIDPTLRYSTYWGGSFLDFASGLAADAAGNAYVTGTACSADFPIVPKPAIVQATYGGSCDAFVAKVNPNGTAFVYSTYLGGERRGQRQCNRDRSFGRGLCDRNGGRRLPGYCLRRPAELRRRNFRCIRQQDQSGWLDAGLFHLPGRQRSRGRRGDRGSAGLRFRLRRVRHRIHRASTDFPATAGAFQTANGCTSGGTPCADPYDAFVARLNSSGSLFKYATYLGGHGGDGGFGIAADSLGDAYVGGITDAILIPTISAELPDNAATATPEHLRPGRRERLHQHSQSNRYRPSSVFDLSRRLGLPGDQRTGAWSGQQHICRAAMPTPPISPSQANAYQPTFGGFDDMFVVHLVPAPNPSQSRRALLHSGLLDLLRRQWR